MEKEEWLAAALVLYVFLLDFDCPTIIPFVSIPFAAFGTPMGIDCGSLEATGCGQGVQFWKCTGEGVEWPF